MFVAIDRTSKFVFVELHDRATRRIASDFLKRLIDLAPYKIHTVLTDNGVQFTDPKGDGWTVADIKAMLDAGQLFRCVGFDLVCARHDIDHRLTKPNHPWSLEEKTTVQWTVVPTNGQVERMNRTIKEATVRRFHYDTHDQLRAHLDAFVGAYNFAKRLKTLKGLTPFEFIVQKWKNEPKRFTKHPDNLSAGLNS